MKPALAQFESMNLITVVDIDMDRKSNPEYVKYKKLYTAKYIPFTVIVSPTGEVVYEKVGGLSCDELVKETRKHVK